MWHVDEVISVIGGLLHEDWHLVGKGRQWLLHWAVILWPHPQVWEWRGGKSNDWHTLVWDSSGIGVLMAHDDNSSSINRESILKLSVSELQVGDFLVNDVKVKSVGIDLSSVIINIRGILFNIRLVLLNVSLEMGNSLLKG